MPTLRSRLQELSASFAHAVVDAIRGASLEELVGNDGPRRRSSTTNLKAVPAVSVGTKPSRKPGRLPRRSAEEIAKALDKIVLLVKTHKNGMRAEEIRAKLGMEAKEMPRILKEGVSKKKLVSKGQKRATTYFAK